MNEAALEQLEESLRGHESLSGVNDFNELTKKFIEHGETIKTLRGELEGKVAIPKEDASEEERKAFYKAMGVPDSIDGYEIKKPENLPEGMSYDETLADIILKTLHEAGASKSLAHSVFKQFNDYTIGLQNKFNEYVKEGNEKRIAVLKKAWGNDFEKKNEETFRAISKLVERADIPKEFFPGSENSIEGFKKYMAETGLDTDPVQNFLWNKVFELIGGDTFVKGKASSAAGEGFLDEMYPEMKK